MKNYGAVTDPKDITTKEYVDAGLGKAGNMLKENYANQSPTKVDTALNSEKLGGRLSSDFIVNVPSGTLVGVVPINADTLGGIPAIDFAQKRDVIDTLSSTSLNMPLSANQGKILNELKAPISSPLFTGTPKCSPNRDYAVSQIRNTIYSTVDPIASDGNDGDLYIVYEV